MKMSKSLGNYIGVTDSSREMFGKTMRIPDELMPDYYAQLLNQPIPEADPVEQKRALARSLVSRFHDTSAVEDAERTFYAQARREIPDDIPEVYLPEREEVWIIDLITHAGFANTNGEARRFIRGGAGAPGRRSHPGREALSATGVTGGYGSAGRETPLRAALGRRRLTSGSELLQYPARL